MTASGGRHEVRLSELPPKSELPGLGVPAWVSDLMRVPRLTGMDGGRGAVRSRIEDGARFCIVTSGFDRARGMDILTFQQRVVEAYQAVFQELETSAHSHPVRFWALLPGIHDGLGAGLDRYMAFNAGRYRAYASYYGQPTSFGRSIPTSSAVGVHGDQLVLHCLAADEPGLPIENPRQIPAYLYSRHFGPMPPCFARATLLGEQTDEPLLLVGGTASIVGEESVHLGRLEDQAWETFRNLASLVASAGGQELPEEATATCLAPFLAAFRDLRVYYTRSSDQPTISGLVQAAFSSRCRVELLQASLCRAELLVEIEGLALPPPRRLAT